MSFCQCIPNSLFFVVFFILLFVLFEFACACYISLAYSKQYECRSICACVCLYKVYFSLVLHINVFLLFFFYSRPTFFVILSRVVFFMALCVIVCSPLRARAVCNELYGRTQDIWVLNFFCKCICVCVIGRVYRASYIKETFFIYNMRIFIIIIYIHCCYCHCYCLICGHFFSVIVLDSLLVAVIRSFLLIITMKSKYINLTRTNIFVRFLTCNYFGFFLS